MEAARPTHTVDTSGLMCRIVSNTAIPVQQYRCSASAYPPPSLKPEHWCHALMGMLADSGVI